MSLKSGEGKSLKGEKSAAQGGNIDMKTLLAAMSTSGVSLMNVTLQNSIIYSGLMDDVLIGSQQPNNAFFYNVQMGMPDGNGATLTIYGNEPERVVYDTDGTVISREPGDMVTWDPETAMFNIFGGLMVRDPVRLGNIEITENRIYAINPDGNVEIIPESSLGKILLAGNISQNKTGNVNFDMTSTFSVDSQNSVINARFDNNITSDRGDINIITDNRSNNQITNIELLRTTTLSDTQIFVGSSGTTTLTTESVQSLYGEPPRKLILEQTIFTNGFITRIIKTTKTKLIVNGREATQTDIETTVIIPATSTEEEIRETTTSTVTTYDRDVPNELEILAGGTTTYTALFTTEHNHGLLSNENVSIVDTDSDPTFDGSHVIETIPTPNTFTLTPSSGMFVEGSTGMVMIDKQGSINLYAGKEVNFEIGVPVYFGQPTVADRPYIEATTANDITLSTKFIRLQDPIPTLQTPSTQFSDSGIAVQYNDNNVTKSGFFGFVESTQNFTWIPNATITRNADGSKTVSGVKGIMELRGVQLTDLIGDPNLNISTPQGTIKFETQNPISFDSALKIGQSTIIPVGPSLTIDTPGTLSLTTDNGVTITDGQPLNVEGINLSSTTSIKSENGGLILTSSVEPVFIQGDLSIPTGNKILLGTEENNSIYGDSNSITIAPKDKLRIPDDVYLQIGDTENTGLISHAGTMNVNSASNLLITSGGDTRITPTSGNLFLNAEQIHLPSESELLFGTQATISTINSTKFAFDSDLPIELNTTNSSIDLSTPNASINIDSLQPKINLETPNASINIDSLQPKINLETPNASVILDSSHPEIKLTTPKSSVHIDSLHEFINLSTPKSSVNIDSITESINLNTQGTLIELDNVSHLINLETINSNIQIDGGTQITPPSISLTTPNAFLKINSGSPSSIVDITSSTVNLNVSDHVFIPTDKPLKFGTEDDAQIVHSSLDNKLHITDLNGVVIERGLIVNGPITFNGPTTEIITTKATIEDPIISLGISTISEYIKDRGIEFFYDNGKRGFMGYKQQDNKFVLIKEGQNIDEVFTKDVLGDLEVGKLYADIMVSSGGFSSDLIKGFPHVTVDASHLQLDLTEYMRLPFDIPFYLSDDSTNSIVGTHTGININSPTVNVTQGNLGVGDSHIVYTPDTIIPLGLGTLTISNIEKTIIDSILQIKDELLFNNDTSISWNSENGRSTLTIQGNGTDPLEVSIKGSITDAVWNGQPLDPSYGGTGHTGPWHARSVVFVGDTSLTLEEDNDYFNYNHITKCLGIRTKIQQNALTIGDDGKIDFLGDNSQILFRTGGNLSFVSGKIGSHYGISSGTNLKQFFLINQFGQCGINQTSEFMSSLTGNESTKLYVDGDISFTRVPSSILFSDTTYIRNDNTGVILHSTGALAVESASVLTISSGSLLSMSSTADLTMTSGNQLTITSNTLTMTSVNQLTITGNENLTMSSADTLTITSDILRLSSEFDLTITSGENLTMSSEFDLTMSSGETLTMSSTDDLTITSGNQLTMSSIDTLTIASSETLTMSSTNILRITSGNQLTMSSTDDLTITSGENLSISSVSLLMSTTSNMSVTSGSNLNVTSTSALNVSSGSNLTIASGNQFDITSLGNMNINSDANITIHGLIFSLTCTSFNLNCTGPLSATSASIALSSTNFTNITSTGNITIDSAETLSLHGKNLSILCDNSLLLQSATNLTLTSLGLLNLNSGGNFSISTASNLSISATNLNISTTNNFTTSVTGNIITNGTGDMETNITGNLSFSIGQGISMNCGQAISVNSTGILSLVTDDELLMQSGKRMRIISNSTLTATSSLAFVVSSGSTMDVNSTGAMNLTSAGTLNLTSVGALNLTSDGTMSLISDDNFSIASNANVDVLSQLSMHIESRDILDVTSTGDMTISTLGKLTISSTDEFEITSSSLLTLQSTDDLLIQSQDALYLRSEGNMQINSSALLNLSSISSCSIQSGSALSLSSINAFDIHSSAALTLNSLFAMTLNSDSTIDINSFSKLSLISQGNILISSAQNLLLDSINLNITANDLTATIAGTVSIASQLLNLSSSASTIITSGNECRIMSISNLFLTSSTGDISVTSSTGDITIQAAQDLKLISGAQLHFVSQSLLFESLTTLEFRSQESMLFNSNSTIDINSVQLCSITSLNGILLSAITNKISTLSATFESNVTGSFKVTANEIEFISSTSFKITSNLTSTIIAKNLVANTTEDITLLSSRNTTLTSSLNTTISSENVNLTGGNLVAISSQQNVSLSAIESIVVESGNSLSISAVNQLNLSSLSVLAISSTSVMNVSSSILNLTGNVGVTISSQEDISLTSLRNLSITTSELMNILSIDIIIDARGELNFNSIANTSITCGQTYSMNSILGATFHSGGNFVISGGTTLDLSTTTGRIRILSESLFTEKMWFLDDTMYIDSSPAGHLEIGSTYIIKLNSPHVLIPYRLCLKHSEGNPDTCQIYMQPVPGSQPGNTDWSFTNTVGDILLNPLTKVYLPDEKKIEFGNIGSIGAIGNNLTISSTNNIALAPDGGKVLFPLDIQLDFGNGTSTISQNASGLTVSSSTQLNFNVPSIFVPDNTPVVFGDYSRRIVSDGDSLFIYSTDLLNLESNNVKISGNLTVTKLSTFTVQSEANFDSGIIVLGGGQIRQIIDMQGQEDPLGDDEVLVTLNADHNLRPGDKITITDTIPNIDGVYFIKSVPDTDSLVIAKTYPGLLPGAEIQGYVRSALTQNNGTDIGIQVNWHTGATSDVDSAKIGFFGFDRSTGRWTFIQDASRTGETFSGTPGDIQVGNVYANGISISQLLSTLNAGSQLVTGSNFNITGGVINGTVIGNLDPDQGTFTTLYAQDDLYIGGVSIYDLLQGLTSDRFVFRDGTSMLTNNWYAGDYRITTAGITDTTLTEGGFVLAGVNGKLETSTVISLVNGVLTVPKMGPFQMTGDIDLNGFKITGGTFSNGILLDTAIHRGDIYDTELHTVTIHDSNVINTAIEDSTFVSGDIHDTDISMSRLTTSTATSMTIDSSQITGTTFKTGTLQDSTGIRLNISESNLVNSTFANGEMSNSTLTDGTVTSTVVVNSSFINGIIQTSTTSNSSFVSGTIVYSSFNDGTITRGTLDDSIFKNGTIQDTNGIRVTLDESVFTNGNITESNVTESTISNNTITGNALSGNTLSSNTLTGNTLTGNSWSEGTISNAGISGGTISNAGISGGTISNAGISGGTISNAGISGGTINNAGISNGTYTEGVWSNGTMDATAITNSSFSNGTVTLTNFTEGNISTTNITNSAFNNGTLSTVVIDNSQYKNGTLTNNVLTSNQFNNGTISATSFNSGIIDLSSIIRTSFDNGTIDNSTIDNSTIDSTSIINSTVDNTSVTNSTINSTLFKNGNIETSILTGNEIHQGTIDGTVVTNVSISQSQYTQGTLTNNTLTSNTLTSNVYESGIIRTTAISNSTVDSTSVTNSTIATSIVTNSTIDTSVITNSTMNDSALNRIVIRDSQYLNGTLSGNTMSNNVFNNGHIDTTNMVNSTIASTMINTSQFKNGNIVTSTMDNSDFTSGRIVTSSFTDGTVSTSIFNDGTVNDSFFNSGTVNDTLFQNGTIESSNITVPAGKSLDVSAGNLVLRDDQISGEKIAGGTADIDISGNAETVTNGLYRHDFSPDHTIMKADIAGNPYTLVVPENTLVGRLPGEVISALPVDEVQEMLDIVRRSLYVENSILKADIAREPEALVIPEDTIVGRVAGGEIDALNSKDWLYNYGALMRDGDRTYTNGGTMTGNLYLSYERFSIVTGQTKSIDTLVETTYINVGYSRTAGREAKCIMGSGVRDGHRKVIIVSQLGEKAILEIQCTFVAPGTPNPIWLVFHLSGQSAVLQWDSVLVSWVIVGTGCQVVTQNDIDDPNWINDLEQSID